MPTLNEFTFLSCNGKNNVFFIECVPDGEVRGVLQIAHGIAEHCKRYIPFMQFMASNGFVCVANDHLGHGRTAKDPSEYCFFGEENGWNMVVEDMDRLRRLESAKYPNLPYFLLGHSMGSFLTRTYIIKHPDVLTGAIISGTGQNPGVVVAAGKAMANMHCNKYGAKYPDEKLDSMAFGGYNKKFDSVRTKFDWLTRDPAVVDAYIADPMCGMLATCGLMRDMMGGLQFIWKEENLQKMKKDMPVYFYSGDMDPVGDWGKGTKKVYERFIDTGMQDVKLKLYPNGRHEMLNEINKEEVYKDILEWIDSKL